VLLETALGRIRYSVETEIKRQRAA